MTTTLFYIFCSCSSSIVHIRLALYTLKCPYFSGDSSACSDYSFTLSSCGAASYGLSLLFLLYLFIILSICPSLPLHYGSLCPVFSPSSPGVIFGIITFHVLVSFCAFLPFPFPSFPYLCHVFSLFYRFKLLVHFSSRAVVGLAPLLAHRAVDVGSSLGPPSPRVLGWPTRLQIPPLCTLCPARPL